MDHQVGTEIPGYRIDSVIGRGGMGVVYLAEDLHLKRKVALKVLVPELAEDPMFRDRFVRESQLAASLDHPNIIPIYEAREAGRSLYIAMRYVPGLDLKTLIAQEGPLSPERTVSILDQAASALDAAHAQGLIHRDVKPGNILITPRSDFGKTDRVFLSDFGLTKRASSDSGITATGQFVGTLDYAAPEQFEGKPLDARTDVYSLGCVVFECLTGEVPFKGENEAALVYAHLLKPPPKLSAIRPKLSTAVDQVVAKSMAKSPDDRYLSATAFTEAARSALGVERSRTIIRPETLPAAAPPDGARRGRSRSKQVAGAGLALLAVVVAIILLLRAGGKPASRASSHGRSASAVDRLVRIEPSNRKVIASIPVAMSPVGIAVGEGSIWVVTDDGTIDRIDPVTNKISGVIHVGAGASGIAFDEGSIWVANSLKSSVEEIDPGTNQVVATISVDRPTTIAARGGVLFIGSFGIAEKRGGYRVGWTMLDEASRRVIKSVSSHAAYVPDAPFVAEGAGAAWTGGVGGVLDKVDANTGRLIKRGNLGFRVNGITVEESGVWIATDGQPAQVRFVDPATLRITATIPVGKTVDNLGGAPISMASGSGSLWVTNANDGTISQIVIASNITVATIDLGRTPTGVALGFNSLWVTVDAP